MIAIQKFPELGVGTGLDEGVECQRFVKMSQDAHCLGRKTIDAGFGEVPAVVMPRGEKIDKD